MARKLNHFSQKQFQFKQALDVSIERRFAVLKGQLYFATYHYAESSTLLRPHWVNSARRIGLWGRDIMAPAEQFYCLQRHEWICQNAQASSLPNQWWTNGLYYQEAHSQFYMYRAASLMSFPPLTH